MICPRQRNADRGDIFQARRRDMGIGRGVWLRITE